MMWRIVFVAFACACGTTQAHPLSPGESACVASVRASIVAPAIKACGQDVSGECSTRAIYKRSKKVEEEKCIK
jgi:hypothetical protein